MPRLTSNEANLLVEVLKNDRQDVLTDIISKGLAHLSLDRLEEIKIYLVDELCSTGLRDDDEPNQRGLMLENISNFVGRIFVSRQNP